MIVYIMGDIYILFTMNQSNPFILWLQLRKNEIVMGFYIIGRTRDNQGYNQMLYFVL